MRIVIEGESGGGIVVEGGYGGEGEKEGGHNSLAQLPRGCRLLSNQKDIAAAAATYMRK